MKVSILFLITMSVCFAGSGVDVGNGSRRTFYHTPDVIQEFHLKNNLENIIQNIRNNEISDIQKLIEKADCSSKVKIGEIGQEDKYNILKQGKKFQKRYKGVIELILQDCKTPNMIPLTLGNNN